VHPEDLVAQLHDVLAAADVENPGPVKAFCSCRVHPFRLPVPEVDCLMGVVRGKGAVA
jgi:hypothetical protein